MKNDPSAKSVNEDSETLYAFGYQCLNEGQFKKAANVFLLLLHSDPDRVRILIGLGVSMRKLGRYEGARVAFEEAVKIEPEDPRGSCQLGITLILLGESGAGRRLLGAALALCDRDVARWSALRKTIACVLDQGGALNGVAYGK